MVQDQRIRVSKEHTVLESDFDEVLGQEATQDQVFTAAQGPSACLQCLSVVCSSQQFTNIAVADCQT